ncbi:MAG: 2-hydroxyacid dehydrogenase, partial [Beijerinckiaceae bacterium]
MTVDVLMTAPTQPLIVNGVDKAFRLHKAWEAKDPPAFIREVAPKIRGIALGGHTAVDEAFLAQFPALEIVASLGVGYDHVDTKAAAKRGVIVTHTPDVLNEEVADTALGLVLNAVRQLPQSEKFLRSGQWLKGNFPLTASLREKTAGIAGLGRIGKAIAKRLEAFGVKVVYYGRTQQKDVSYRWYGSLTDMARDVDILISVLPGGAATKYIINADVLKALGPEGVLVNIGRGTVVDEQALITALKNKTIATAALDVFEDEPRVPEELIAMEHVVLFPHVGSGSIYTRNAMGQLVVDNLIDY